MAPPIGTTPGRSVDTTYKPLLEGEIRLFKLNNHSDESNKENFEISFRSCTISEVENGYVAVSYTWLDKTFDTIAQDNRPHVSVSCNGTHHARATRL